MESHGWSGNEVKKFFLIFLLITSPLFAGRDFDGTNDQIAFGSNASIDNFTSRTFSAWVRVDSTGSTRALLTKGSGTTHIFLANSTDRLRYVSDWTTTDGNWIGTAVFSDATFKHLCMTYSQSNIANDPTFFINAASDALATDTNPTGTPVISDAANTMIMGETSAGNLDFDGVTAFFVYNSTLFSQAQCNTAKYWGRPFGGLVVYHPLLTDKLSNEGSGGAEGTATGTTVVSSPVPVVRPGFALLNDGIGW